MAIDYFNELLAKYRNISYPSSTQRQVDYLRNDLRKDILTPQFDQARIEYQNMLAGTGVNRRSVDATAGGEQQQIIINPTTGATEIVTPEYNRMFRTDATDFNPGGQGSFENIYDADLGKIDPRTGRPKDEVTSTDTGTGTVTQRTSGTEGREGRENREQQNNITHEVINGVAYRIDTETGKVEMLDGLDAIIANTANTFVSNFTLSGILAGGKSYHDKMQDLKEVSEDAYNAVTANVREQARTAYGDGYDEPSLAQNLKTDFNIAKNWIGGLISGDDDSDNDDITPTKKLSFVNGKAVFTDSDEDTPQSTQPSNITTTITPGLITDQQLTSGGGGNQGNQNQGGYQDVAGVSRGRNIHG
tara:strand:- start:102 stop:1181 length:1080 start_codon:yes stop_codon:yes gene_type:complete